MATYYGCESLMSLPEGVSIRPMAMTDVPAGLGLCRASRWNQVARDWERFLTASPRGAAVATRDGRVVGSVATLPYESRFTWISMVLVDPAERGLGIGTALLEHGLSLADSSAVPRLDATPAGEVVYRPLGFVGEFALTRWRLDRRASVARHPDARPLDASDWPAVLSLDSPVFGAARGEHLRWLAEGAPEYAWVIERGGTIDAFLLGRYGHHRDQLGPIVARGPASAEALVASCLAAHPDGSFYLDAPDAHAGWRGWLSALGFINERPFLRMHRGKLAHPGQPALTFAIAGPEFG